MEADSALGGWVENAEEAGEDVCEADLTTHMQSRQSWESLLSQAPAPEEAQRTQTALRELIRRMLSLSCSAGADEESVQGLDKGLCLCSNPHY